MKKFEKPEMIIAKFDSSSVIVASGTAMDEANNSISTGISYKLGGADND